MVIEQGARTAGFRHRAGTEARVRARRGRFAAPALAALTALVLGTSSCPSRANQGRATPQFLLQFLDSVALSGPATGLCADRDGILVLDQAGTNIYRFDLDLRAGPVTPLTSRLPGLRGIAADPFFIFLFDNTRVYRMDRSSGEVSQVASGIDCQGAAVLAGGELAFSDRTSGHVLLLDPTGNMSVLNVERPDLQPGALTVGNDGNFYILNAARREVDVFNRIGEELAARPLPQPGMRIAIDDSLRVYVLQRTGTSLWQVTPRGHVAAADPAQLGAAFTAADIVVVKTWLYALDRGTCLRRYRITSLPD